MKIDPELDLVLDRTLDVPKELIWKVWTEEVHLPHWFCPRPWSVSDCKIEARPGGVFSSTMRSPEGESFPNVGCFLELVENKKIVWTDALLPGFRPVAEPTSGAGLKFTAMLLLEGSGSTTKYTAIAVHATEEDRKKHEQMGFHEGWGMVADQMVEYIKKNLMK